LLHNLSRLHPAGTKTVSIRTYCVLGERLYHSGLNPELTAFAFGSDGGIFAAALQEEANGLNTADLVTVHPSGPMLNPCANPTKPYASV
jgi:hypothetical protein